MPSARGRPQRVDEGVVGVTSRVVGPRLGDAQGALHPDPGVGQRDLRRVEADQPAGGGVPAVGGRVVEAPVELVELVRVEQHPHGPDRAAGEHVGVERGLAPGSPWRWSARSRPGSRRSARCAGTAGSVMPVGADAELRGRAVRVQVGGGRRRAPAPWGASGMTVIRSGSAGLPAGVWYGCRTPM